MRVGVIDLLSMPSTNLVEVLYRSLLTKQYASIMPQSVAVWARQLGHEVHYATYYGRGDPARVLPPDLDVLFVSSFTHVSPAAYALAKLYAKSGTLTVLGGPHARAFPEDSLRFFDLVVRHCDRQLVADVLAGAFDRHSAISSAVGGLDELPSVEERWPYIQQSACLGGRPYSSTTVPLLASTGCPYACDFCLDWDTPYRLLPTDRVRADLAFLAKRAPRVRLSFHDPNLATGWDTMLNLFEEVPPALRSPLVVESSLASLKSEERLRRLRDARCLFIGVGLESWAGYSGKAGVGAVKGTAKVPLVVEELRQVAEYVPYLQASFMFGLDVDEGEEPVTATKEFISQAPFVWPAINIPQPFGNTPLHTQWSEEGRLLTAMPFYFYQAPFLTTIPKHYGAIEYYEKMLELQSHAASTAVLRRRLKATRGRQVQLVQLTRTLGVRRALAVFPKLLEAWKSDRQLLAFHDGQTEKLPEVYEGLLRRSLGPLSQLLTRADLTPVHPSAEAGGRRPAEPATQVAL